MRSGQVSNRPKVIWGSGWIECELPWRIESKKYCSFWNLFQTFETGLDTRLLEFYDVKGEMREPTLIRGFAQMGDNFANEQVSRREVWVVIQ